MAKIESTMECLDALMEKMSANGITSLKVKDKDLEIELKSEKETIVTAVPQQITSSVVSSAPEKSAPKQEMPKGNVVKAPIVGTFYSSASPKDKPFATSGQQVHKGDVLFIIESMKVMNEVKSEFNGTVITVNVKDGEAVEYDQPVMIIG